MKAKHEFNTYKDYYEYMLTYFAAKAMQGVMTSPEQYNFSLRRVDETANFCYQIAEAMLTERQKHL